MLHQFDCSVCFQPMKDPVTINCGHSFCYRCMIKTLSTIPRCPLCRCFIQIKPDQFKVCVLLSDMIKNSSDSIRQNENKQKIEQQTYLTLYTDQYLYQYSYIRVKIKQNKSITISDYLHCYQDASIFAINSQLKQIIQGKIIKIQLIHSSIIAYILTKNYIELSKIHSELFVIEIIDTFGTKDNKDILLELGQGRPIQINYNYSTEELRELNHLKHMIQQHIELIFNKNHLMDAIESEVYQNLQLVGIFNYLQESDIESLDKLSLCLSSILQISDKQKQQLVQKSIQQRLKQCQKELFRLSRYKHGGMIFKLPNEHPTAPVVELFIVILILITYLIFMN